jgi:5'-methylthioadenosine phosphorylase
VTVDAVIKVLTANADNARALIKTVAPMLYDRPLVDEQDGDTALEYALITHPEARDPAVVARLDAVAGRMLKG